MDEPKKRKRRTTEEIMKAQEIELAKQKEKLEQAQNRLKAIQARYSAEERKKRNRRLFEIGETVEQVVGGKFDLDTEEGRHLFYAWLEYNTMVI